MNPAFIRAAAGEFLPGKSSFKIRLWGRKTEKPTEDPPVVLRRSVPDEGKHARYYFAGKKQEDPINKRAVDDEEKKTVFVVDEIPVAKRGWRKWIDIPSWLFGRSQTKTVDRDLVTRLRFEAAFCQRDAVLARTLTNRARQFLADFDQHRLTAEESYSMAIRAVGEAMRISAEEETLGCCLEKARTTSPSTGIVNSSKANYTCHSSAIENCLHEETEGAQLGFQEYVQPSHLPKYEREPGYANRLAGNTQPPPMPLLTASPLPTERPYIIAVIVMNW